jgi:para-nitrobenzyl esterase
MYRRSSSFRSSRLRTWATRSLVGLVAALCACSDDEPSAAGADAGDSGSPDAQSDALGDSPADSLADSPADAPPDVAEPDLVVTTSGPVRGQLAEEYRAFLGIPYAAPPVGERRWALPEAPAPWTEPRDATQYGLACPQYGMGPLPAPANDEDCLFLNVWSPNPAPTNAPVMVWIHGGGFVLGAGSNSSYSGHVLAQKGVVVVTFNYRLGPLGFLAHEALVDPEQRPLANLGLHDQLAALRWVRDNITVFGGDPGNVTIFGESAGASSVYLHLVMPASAGLFHRAVMQSGVLPVAPTLTEAQATGAALAEALDCGSAADVLACLRSASVRDVLDALGSQESFFFAPFTWLPVLDGELIPATPYSLVEAGELNPVPVLLGNNADEGSLFLLLEGRGKTAEDYQEFVEWRGGEHAAALAAEYPLEDYASPDAALAQIIADGSFVCPTRIAARALTEAGVDTRVYLFTHAVTIMGISDLGAFHGAEIYYVMGAPTVGVSLDADDLALSEAMQGYWTRMARDGDPNGDGAVDWPAYASPDEPFLQFDLTIAAEQGFGAEHCDFWTDLLAPVQ